MKRLFVCILLLATIGGCTDPRTAQRALDDLGFTEVTTTGYSLFGCGEDYTFHTGFQAKNPRGKIVTGTVCSGWLKGASVKFD